MLRYASFAVGLAAIVSLSTAASAQSLVAPGITAAAATPGGTLG